MSTETENRLPGLDAVTDAFHKALHSLGVTRAGEAAERAADTALAVLRDLESRSGGG